MMTFCFGPEGHKNASTAHHSDNTSNKLAAMTAWMFWKKKRQVEKARQGKRQPDTHVLKILCHMNP